jgi:hypothetical protein
MITLYLIYKMGNPASKSSIQKNNSINKSVNVVNSSGYSILQSGPFKPREATPPSIETQTCLPNSAGATEATMFYSLDLSTNGNRLYL